MKSLKLIFVASLALLAVATMAKEPTADQVLAKASAKAKAGHKNVMVIFHASWCIWCHRFDAFLDDPAGSPIKNNYVIVHLDVLEQPEKKALENQGGMAKMEAWGGKDQGIPFTVILDPSGKVLADSMSTLGAKPANIGFPAEPDEVKWFMQMVDKSSSMSESDKAKVQAGLASQKYKNWMPPKK